MTKPYGRIYKNKTNISIDARDLYNVWPIGSIYISVVNTNPSQWFGGTWQSFGSGRVLVGVDTSQAEFNTVEKTGGEKEHTLTTNEMPKHQHPGLFYNNKDKTPISFIRSSSTTEKGYGIAYTMNAKIYSAANIQTYASGGSKPHNNIQPYITVYMWKRIN